MGLLRDALLEVAAAARPATCRQIFYRMVSVGAIEKTEAGYQNVVIRLLGELRRDGALPYEWIADSTRWMRKPTTYSGLDHALMRSARSYRRALWDTAGGYVEVWCEKEALAGVIVDVTDHWDVPLLVTRGYPSLSYLHAAAETIAAQERPCYLYHLGDLDPSGTDIDRCIESGIRELAPAAEIHFERIAVLHHQVEEFSLLTRPTKRSDTRAANYEHDYSVEVDAIDPTDLRELVEGAILQHLDWAELGRLRVIEAEERRTLATIAANFSANEPG